MLRFYLSSIGSLNVAKSRLKCEIRGTARFVQNRIFNLDRCIPITYPLVYSPFEISGRLSSRTRYHNYHACQPKPHFVQSRDQANKSIETESSILVELSDCDQILFFELDLQQQSLYDQHIPNLKVTSTPYYKLKEIVDTNPNALNLLFGGSLARDQLIKLCTHTIAMVLIAQDIEFLMKFLPACSLNKIPISPVSFSLIWRFFFSERKTPQLILHARHIFERYLLPHLVQYPSIKGMKYAALEYLVLFVQYQPRLAHQDFIHLNQNGHSYPDLLQQLMIDVFFLHIFAEIGQRDRITTILLNIEIYLQILSKLDDYASLRTLASMAHILTKFSLQFDVPKATKFSHVQFYVLDWPSIRHAYLSSQILMADHWMKSGHVQEVDSIYCSLLNHEAFINQVDKITLRHKEHLIMAHARSSELSLKRKTILLMNDLEKATTIYSPSTSLCNALIEYKLNEGFDPAHAEMSRLANQYAFIPNADTFCIFIREYAKRGDIGGTLQEFIKACKCVALNEELYFLFFRHFFQHGPYFPENQIRFSGLVEQFERLGLRWNTEAINLVLEILLKLHLHEEAILFFKAHERAKMVFLDTRSINLLFEIILDQRLRPNLYYFFHIFDLIVDKALKNKAAAASELVNYNASTQENISEVFHSNFNEQASLNSLFPSSWFPLTENPLPNTNGHRSSSIYVPVEDNFSLNIFSLDYDPSTIPDSKSFELRSLAGNVDERLLPLMERLNLIPTGRTFQIILNSAIRHGDATLALQILSQWLIYHSNDITDNVLETVITSFVNLGAQSHFKTLEALVSGLSLSTNIRMSLRYGVPLNKDT